MKHILTPIRILEPGDYVRTDYGVAVITREHTLWGDRYEREDGVITPVVYLGQVIYVKHKSSYLIHNGEPIEFQCTNVDVSVITKDEYDKDDNDVPKDAPETVSIWQFHK